MHPQLSDKKALACKDLMQALEDCHLSVFAKMTGGCNRPKNELNACLHKETLARSVNNREGAKVRRSKHEDAVKNFYDEQ